MKIEIKENQFEKVVFIEYFDNIPIRAITTDNGFQTNWDIAFDHRDIEEFMHYNWGSGGSIKKIQAPSFVEPQRGSYWLHNSAALNGKTQSKRIYLPIEHKEIHNPFKQSREVWKMIWCERCECEVDDEWCEHLDWSEEKDCIVYTDGEIHESYK